MVSTVDDVRWFKSSRSATNGACVEVSFLPGTVAVRDSKDPDGPVLSFDATAWRDFLGSVKAGQLDI